MSGRKIRSMVVVLSLALTAGWVLAQGTSSAILVGTVVDATGGILPGVTVTAVHEETGRVRTTVTNERGDYRMPALAIGLYRVTAELPGFRTTSHRGVELQVDARVRVDITLQVGEVTDEVQVAASLPSIETEHSTVENIIQADQLLDMPLNVRDPLELLHLTAGIDTGEGGERSQFFAVSGNRGTRTGFQVEGNISQELIHNTPAAVPPLDSVQEFRVKTAVGAADSGMGAAQVQMAVRSGTNRFHGSVYHFYRGNVLDARNFFAPLEADLPHLVRNQFGARLGGPIIRDRTFFFVNYEGRRERGERPSLSTMPSLAVRQGDFTAEGVTLQDPFDGHAPFPGNVIPEDRFHPRSLQLLPYIPEPNLPGLVNNFFVNLTATNDQDAFIGRVDHALSGSQQLSAIVSLTNRESLDPQTTPNVGSHINEIEERYINVRHDFTISPNLLNQLSVGTTLFDRIRLPENQHRNIVGEEMGLPDMVNPNDAGGFPDLFIRQGGYERIREFAIRDEKSHIVSVTNDMSFIRGNHALKFGGNVVMADLELTALLLPRPMFDFRNTHTRHGFGDFLLGMPFQVQLDRGGDYGRMKRTYFSGYLMDDWAITPRLTVNAGIRYELYTVPIEKNNQLSIYDFDTPGGVIVSSSNGQPPTGVLPIYEEIGMPIRLNTEAGLPRGLGFADKNNFMPRLGFAYRLFGGSKTVLRGGYGWFYSPIRMNLRLLGANRNPPFTVRDTRRNNNRNNPLVWEDLLDAPIVVPNTTVTGFAPDFKDALSQQWNLTLEQDLGWNTGLRLSYVGNRGTNLPMRLNFNQTRREIDPATGQQISFTPDPGFAAIDIHTAAASSWYNAGEMELRRRFSQDLSFQGSWTWGKLLSHIDRDLDRPQNTWDVASDWGDANYQRRHMVKVNFMYDLPFGQGKRLHLSGPAEHILGGWRLAANGRFYTGGRLSPHYSSIPVDTEIVNGRPDRVPGCDPNDAPRTPGHWFNAGCFTLPPVPADGIHELRFGDAARNLVVGPGVRLVDLSLQKGFNLTEETRFSLRIQAFNAFNTANFGDPQTDLSAASAGVISSAGPARQFQIGARIEF